MNPVSLNRPRRNRISKPITVAALAVLVLMLAAPLQVSASCSDNKRNIDQFHGYPEAKTYAKNGSDVSITGRIYRNDNLKAEQDLGKDDEMSQVAGKSGKSAVDANMRIEFHNTDNGKQAACYYTFTLNSNHDVVGFKNQRCEDASSVCQGCAISCKKSWNSNKNRWNVHFHLEQ